MDKYKLHTFLTKLAYKAYDIEYVEARTLEEWREFKRMLKQKGWVVYFVVETLPDVIEDIYNFFNIVDHLHSFAYFLRKKLFGRYDIIKTSLSRDYHDADVRLLYGMFDLLKDFVEIEQAHMMFVFDKEARKQYNYPWWANWFRIVHVRNVEAGLAHLKWAATLDDPTNDSSDDERGMCSHQAHAAREVLVMYDWWVNIRPNRPDVYEVSGWSDHCKKFDNLEDLLTAEHGSEEEKSIMTAIHELEAKYNQEDEDMMIRLIKIRQSLWT